MSVWDLFSFLIHEFAHANLPASAAEALPIPPIFMCCHFIQFKIFSDFLVSLKTSMTHGSFRSMLFIFQVFVGYYLSVPHFQFNSLIVRKHTGYDSSCFNFVKAYRVPQNVAWWWTRMLLLPATARAGPAPVVGVLSSSGLCWVSGRFCR